MRADQDALLRDTTLSNLLKNAQADRHADRARRAASSTWVVRESRVTHHVMARHGRVEQAERRLHCLQEIIHAVYLRVA